MPLDDKVIICADDLSPSEITLLDKNRVLAFVTARGSSNSHTVILARSMNIPVIIGLGEKFLSVIKDGQEAVVDGFKGELIIEPEQAVMLSLQEKKKENDDRKCLLQNLKGKESKTLDGTKINIYASISGVDQIDEALLNDAEGIGLFRSEFLYLESSDYPTEGQQFDAYKKLLESMAGRKVIIRTMDIGADKKVDYFNLEKEDNPALGFRGIRICLSRPEIFKTQLRALYRASPYGNLGIMFPMITSVSEVQRCLQMCEQVKQEMTDEKIPFSNNIELGIMIETPAAAIISDKLADMVDFFSVGTNDLTQYTLACDRQNPVLEDFVDTHHEAVIRLIEMASENAHRHNAWIGICGDLAYDTSLTGTFLRMGIDELSVPPSFLLSVRDIVRRIKLR